MAGIIKRPSQRTGSAFSFNDVAAEAEAQRAEARREAEALLAKTRAVSAAEAKVEHARAYEIGLAEGREAGREQALLEARAEARKAAAARLSEIEDAAVAIVQELEQRKHGLLADAERDLLRLALALASRICKREFELRPAVTAGANLSAAIRRIGTGSRIVVYINRDDLAEVQTLLPKLVASAEQLQHIMLCAADDVVPGGSRLVTPHGCIDTQVETQLEAMALAIVGAAPGHDVPSPAKEPPARPSAFVPAPMASPVPVESPAPVKSGAPADLPIPAEAAQ